MFVDVLVGAIAAYIVYRQETIEREIKKMEASMQRVLTFLDIDEEC